MILHLAAHVPHMLVGSMQGLSGSWVGADLPADLRDVMTLWARGPTGMAGAQLDLAGVEALQQLLGEVAAQMRSAR